MNVGLLHSKYIVRFADKKIDIKTQLKSLKSKMETQNTLWKIISSVPYQLYWKCLTKPFLLTCTQHCPEKSLLV